MKKIIIPLMSILLSSCSVPTYYQVYKATPDNGKVTESKITFEDKKCKLVYNLWGEGGDFGFNIYNKTDNDLIVLTNKSFFILNGIAYDYFKNRVVTETSNVGSVITYNTYLFGNYNPTRFAGTNSSSNSISYAETPYMIVPPGTSKNLAEYIITNRLFESCDMFEYPSRKQIISLKFDRVTSPFVFSNLVSYVSNGDTSRIENKFFISEITNLPESELFKTQYVDNCGNKFYRQIKVAKDSSPDKFYITYFNKN